MSVQSYFNHKIFTCPFWDQCKLPKHQFLCKIPNCKTCSEYALKLKKLKPRVLF